MRYVSRSCPANEPVGTSTTRPTAFTVAVPCVGPLTTVGSPGVPRSLARTSTTAPPRAVELGDVELGDRDDLEISTLPVARSAGPPSHGTPARLRAVAT